MIAKVGLLTCWRYNENYKKLSILQSINAKETAEVIKPLNKESKNELKQSLIDNNERHTPRNQKNKLEEGYVDDAIMRKNSKDITLVNQVQESIITNSKSPPEIKGEITKAEIYNILGLDIEKSSTENVNDEEKAKHKKKKKNHKIKSNLNAEMPNDAQTKVAVKESLEDIFGMS